MLTFNIAKQLFSFLYIEAIEIYFSITCKNSFNASCQVSILKPVALVLLRSKIECRGRHAFCGYSAEETGFTVTSLFAKMALANSYQLQLLSLDK